MRSDTSRKGPLGFRALLFAGLEFRSNLLEDFANLWDVCCAGFVQF